MPTKVTLTGCAGEGKTTIGKELARIKGYKRFSAGDFVRGIAIREGFRTLQALEDTLDRNPAIDYEVDGRTTDLGRTEDRFVFDGRLAWDCIPDAFKVLLICDDDTRFERIAFREQMPLEQVRQETQLRERRMRKRFAEFYPGIGSFDDPKHFNLVVDTTYFSVEEVVARILPWME